MSWKEAATLLLIRPLAKNVVRRTLPTPSQATNAIFANLQRFQEKHDYEIYVGIRSAKSNFFASFLVFPGGGIDQADFEASKWQGLLNGTVPSPCQDVGLPLYEGHKPTDTLLDPRIAFRLCAIRELAEETGLVLSFKPPPSSTMPTIINKTGNIEEHSFFSDILLEMGRLPAVNMLYDWRCWLTPKSLDLGDRNKKNYRYDTIFYMAFVDNEANQIITMPRDNDEELRKCRWATVPELLAQFYFGKLMFPPPQLYELSTLLRYPKFEDLKRFVTQEMAHDKLLRWLPIKAQFVDKAPTERVALLPGDSCYPKTQDEAVALDQVEIGETFEENCRKSKHICRISWTPGDEIKTGKPNLRLFCNLGTFPTGQLPALTGDLSTENSHF